MRLLLACSILLFSVVACVSTPEPDPVQSSAQTSSDVETAPATDSVAPTSDDTASETAVPDELQLPESAATCKRRGGVCTNIHLCVGSGHHTIPVTCPNQNACCV